MGAIVRPAESNHHVNTEIAGTKFTSKRTEFNRIDTPRTQSSKCSSLDPEPAAVAHKLTRLTVPRVQVDGYHQVIEICQKLHHLCIEAVKAPEELIEEGPLQLPELQELKLGGLSFWPQPICNFTGLNNLKILETSIPVTPSIFPLSVKEASLWIERDDEAWGAVLKQCKQLETLHIEFQWSSRDCSKLWEGISEMEQLSHLSIAFSLISPNYSELKWDITPLSRCPSLRRLRLMPPTHSTWEDTCGLLFFKEHMIHTFVSQVCWPMPKLQLLECCTQRSLTSSWVEMLKQIWAEATQQDLFHQRQLVVRNAANF